MSRRPPIKRTPACASGRHHIFRRTLLLGEHHYDRCYNMPRAVILKEHATTGALEDALLRCSLQLNKPKPGAMGPRDVLVEMTCRPVNPSDVMCLLGQYLDFHPSHFPATPGLEGCGVVSQMGEQVQDLKVGDRVIPLIAEYTCGGEGSWQDFVVVGTDDVVKIPDDMPDEMAAQFFVNPWTVLGMVDELGVPAGEYLLQGAASSSLGKEMVAYCHSLGVKTISLVRRESAKEELKALGADLVLNSETDDVHGRVMEVTNSRGAYGAVDPVGGAMTKLITSCTRPHGTVLVYGNMSGGDMLLSPSDLIFRDVHLHGFYISRWVHEKHPGAKARHELASRVLDLFRAGVFRPSVSKKFPLQEFEEAVKDSMVLGKGGKVLLVS